MLCPSAVDVLASAGIVVQPASADGDRILDGVGWQLCLAADLPGSRDYLLGGYLPIDSPPLFYGGALRLDRVLQGAYSRVPRPRRCRRH
jgi:hypothetical protein